MPLSKKLGHISRALDQEALHFDQAPAIANTPTDAPNDAKDVRWDFVAFGYTNEFDPQILKDVDTLVRMAEAFGKKYKGKLITDLGAALEDYLLIMQLNSKVFCYLMLRGSQDLGNEAVKNINKTAEERWSQADAQHLTFFTHEINRLTDEAIAALAKKSATVQKHLPLLRQVRLFKKHQLSEEVEQALALRSPFGAGTWADFFEETEAQLRFTFEGKELTLSEILNVLNDKNRDRRSAALTVINKVLGKFSDLAAQTLNTLSGAWRTEDGARGYEHSMQQRNMSNMLSDGSVVALHNAVLRHAAPSARRFYRLKALLLNLGADDRLRWSDRNAPLPFSDDTIITYQDTKKMVVGAYHSFSPTLAGLVEKIIKSGWIDAPTYPGKRSGAFNLSAELPENKVISFVLLNFLGKPRDVATFAHEVGHGVHGLLAGEAQGSEMMHAPIAYAETASVFGENIVFRGLLEKLRKEGNKKAMLALICEKLDDIINTVVRQISFSEFERRVHDAKRRLSPQELCDIWKQVTREFYGADGDVFTYSDTEWLWTYISHFHRRYYVYGYACGEMVTQSLYAVREKLGDKFETLYLDMLRAGNTKNLVDLLKPFELNPEETTFWENGITVSLNALLTEAEELAKELGLA